MTNIAETATWEAAILRWETTTRATGGVATPFTLPIEQLANRTLYLKALAEAIQALNPVTTRIVGEIAATVLSSVPSGWLPARGDQTIGNASSGATYHDDKYLALFTGLWANNDENNPIYTSAGVLSTRGASSSADWAAGKRISLPELRGEFLRGVDDSRGIDPSRALGSHQKGTPIAGEDNAVDNSVFGGTVYTNIPEFFDAAISGEYSGYKTNFLNGGSTYTGNTNSFGIARPKNVAVRFIIFAGY